MRELSLQDRVQNLFSSTAKGPSMLAAAAAAAARRLEGPMRVAIVGKIKAGKSTFMNALLGEPVAATGGVETTFNVSWLVHAETQSLVVHYRDGRPPEALSIGQLDSVTRFAEGDRSTLKSIAHVEVGHPASILRQLELIDTPGLESVYEDDSENTRRFLSLHGQEMSERTHEEATAADAVVYLFSHGLSTRDEDVLRELQGSAFGRSSPLNAIAVLTKVDAYWPDASDPLEAGQRIVDRLVTQFPKLRQSFYTMRPAMGLLALGAQTLNASELKALRALADLPVETMQRILADVRRLCERDYPDVPVPAAIRKAIWAKLGRYGIARACQELRENLTLDVSGLRARLLAASGIEGLRQILLGHFGHRAYLIKLFRVFNDLKDIGFQLRRRGGSDATAAEVFLANLEEIEMTDPSFAELRALSAYYDGELDLPNEMAEQLLAVTGEYGTSRTARLGLTTSVPEYELQAIAEERTRHWRKFTNNVLGRSHREIAAYRAIAAAYTRLGSPEILAG